MFKFWYELSSHKTHTYLVLIACRAILFDGTYTHVNDNERPTGDGNATNE